MRGLEPENVRTLVALAQMRSVVHQAKDAKSALVRGAPSDGRPPGERDGVARDDRRPFLARREDHAAARAGVGRPTLDVDAALAKLDAKTRGEVMLLLGDLTRGAGRGPGHRAEARWAEASGAVPDELIAPRRARVASRIEAGAGRAAEVAGTVREEFGRLIELARAGSDGTTYAATALRARVKGLSPPIAVQKLSLAIDAAERCGRTVRSRVSSERAPPIEGYGRPSPPIRPSPPDGTGTQGNARDRQHYEQMQQQYRYSLTYYAQQQQQYEQQLAAWQNREAEKSRVRSFKEGELTTTANGTIAEAEAQIEEGLAALSGGQGR